MMFRHVVVVGLACLLVGGCVFPLRHQKTPSTISETPLVNRYDAWPQLKDTVSSQSNPPPFTAKVTIKDVKIPVPQGFSVGPFEYHDSWFETQFPNQGFPFNVVFYHGHYAAVFASSSREFVLTHDGRIVYRGRDRISDMKLVNNGNQVTFTTSSVTDVPSAEEDKKKYVTAGGWGSTPVNREEYLRPVVQCSETKKELEILGENACSNVILLAESKNCRSRLALVSYTPYHTSSSEVVTNPCSARHAVEYWLNGKLVSTLPFPNNATEPLDFAPLLFINEKDGFGMSSDGLHYVINPIFKQIKVGNSGAWIALHQPFYVVNGEELPFDERLQSGAVQVYSNDEGTAYVIEGSYGFLTNDNQFFKKTNHELMGPSAKIEIVSSTVYHYYFDSKE